MFPEEINGRVRNTTPPRPFQAPSRGASASKPSIGSSSLPVTAAPERTGDEDQAKARKPRRSRRASAKAEIPAILPDVTDGYDTDHDGQSVQSARSMRRKSLTHQRRMSAGLGRAQPAPAVVSLDPYSRSVSDEEDESTSRHEEPGAALYPSGTRRDISELTTPRPHGGASYRKRRSSTGPGLARESSQSSSPVMPRRWSAHTSVVRPPTPPKPTNRMRRRSSAREAPRVEPTLDAMARHVSSSPHRVERTASSTRRGSITGRRRAAAERMAADGRSPDSYDQECPDSPQRGQYGYLPRQAEERKDLELDSDSGHTRTSASSSRRSKRRNSGIFSFHVDPLAKSLLGADPESPASGSVHTGSSKKPSPKDPRRSNTLVRSESENEKQPYVARKPFTTPHVKPTPEKLAESEAVVPSVPAEGQQSNDGAWAALNLSSEDDSANEDEEHLASNLYADSTIVQEIDKFKQRARRRASLENSFFSIPQENKEAEARKRVDKLPSFVPAAGCTNASDFIVRVFSARLRLGVLVLKHNKSRWSKSSYRKLRLLPDGKTLSWEPVDGEQDKGRRPKLDLSKCCEVRHAWTRDPDTRRLTGTSVLRKRCKDGMASKSLSLIFNRRTLDLTAVSNDQCKVLMEGFSALCYRLKLDGADEDSSNGSRQELDTEDWASTVYGAESTVSLTHTNTVSNAPPVEAIPISRWGL